MPAIGGSGVILETRAGYRDEDNRHFGLNEAGDTLVHLFSIPNHTCQPIMPDGANVIARRAPIPLFGAGLVEAIADETLLALEDPLDRNRDGVSGRAAIITDVATGQRQSGPVRLEGTACDAAFICARMPTGTKWESPTTCFLRRLRSGSLRHRCTVAIRFPDPEDIRDPSTGRRGIDNFEAFMRFLRASRSGEC